MQRVHLSFTLLVCFFSFGACFGQGLNNQWYFGNQSALNFNSGVPQSSSDHILSSESTVTVSDSSGNLLFFTNGLEIIDRNNNLMPFSEGLGADPESPQSVVVIPAPANSGQYFVVTVGPDSEGAKLRYSVVDMALNQGNGAVKINQKNVLLGEEFEQTLVTTPAPCGVWIVAQKKDVFNANVFYCFLVDFRGIDLPVISSHGIVFNTGGSGFDNLLAKFSPAKDQLVVTGTYEPGFGSTSTEDFLSLFFFNRGEGRVFEHLGFNNSSIFQNVKGSCFSPDGNLLYTSESLNENGQRGVFQYDISQNNSSIIISSRTLIGTPNCFDCVFDMQLGPDNKIYISKNDQNYLASISSPNSFGTACNYLDEAVSLGAGEGKKGLQNLIFPTFQIEGIFSFEDSSICQMDTIVLSPASFFQDLVWQDGSMNSIYEITEPGEYWVTGRLDDCPVRDSVTVLEFSSELDILGEDTILCNEGVLSFDFGSNSGFTYEWSNGINAPQNSFTEEGTIVVEAFDGACTFRDEMDLSFYDAVELGTSDTLLCQGQKLRLNPDVTEASFVWQDGSTSNTFLVETPGIYAVEAIINNQCVEFDQIEVSYSSLSDIDLGPDTTLCNTQDLVLSIENRVGTQYLWQDGSTGFEFEVERSGLYAITVSEAECSFTDQIEVSVRNCCDVYIPNAFSPNGDGINDQFMVFSGCGIESLSLKIFDRKGRLYFEENEPFNEGWDGNFRGEQALEAVYVYIIELELEDGRSELFTGDVSLIR